MQLSREKLSSHLVAFFKFTGLDQLLNSPKIHKSFFCIHLLVLNSNSYRQKDRQTDRQTDRERDRDRETDRERQAAILESKKKNTKDIL